VSQPTKNFPNLTEEKQQEEEIFTHTHTEQANYKWKKENNDESNRNGGQKLPRKTAVGLNPRFLELLFSCFSQTFAFICIMAAKTGFPG